LKKQLIFVTINTQSTELICMNLTISLRKGGGASLNRCLNNRDP